MVLWTASKCGEGHRCWKRRFAERGGVRHFVDFAALSNNFGVTNTDWKQGNFNIDNISNFVDFVELANRFGQTFPLSREVPEPAGIFLLSLVVALGHRRSRYY